MLVCRDNTAWMPYTEDGNAGKDEKSVEDVDVDLVAHEDAIFSHGILDDSENRSHQDESRNSAENKDAGPPGNVGVLTRRCRLSSDALMKCNGSDKEEPEEDNLDCETGDNDILANIIHLLVIG